MTSLNDIKLISIKQLSWPDVFDIWRQNEDYPGSHWISHWQERGFNSWEEWRMTSIEPLGLKGLSWHLYEVAEPFKSIPLFHGGSFRSWIKRYYQDEECPTLAKLANLPEIQNHPGLLKLIANFPKETTITGVIINNEAYIVEGMHRSTALALASQQGLKIDTRLYVALAQYHLDKLPPVGESSNK
jgi:hypothetical protein